MTANPNAQDVPSNVRADELDPLRELLMRFGFERRDEFEGVIAMLAANSPPSAVVGAHDASLLLERRNP